jgi:hypothetical protein
MYHSDDIRNCIQNTINQTKNLKAFIESVFNNIGEPNDVEKILEIKKKADFAEKEIEENIFRLTKRQIRKKFNTPKRISNYYEEKKLKKQNSSASTFDMCFKYYSYIYSLSEKHSFPTFDLKKALETFKLNVTRKKAVKGIENIEYQRDENKNAYKVKVKFMFGIELVIFSEDGPVKNYVFTLSQESLNLKQLLSLFEVKWEYEINNSDRNIVQCLNRAGLWIDSHKFIYTEKCSICDLHLSFKTGFPMLPLVMVQKQYYHVNCYYDLQKEYNSIN